MKKESRFGHSEGITDITLTSDNKQVKKLLSCGSDGDIRVWDGFADPDPAAFSASDSCLSMLCSGNIVLVGTENHTVEAYELPDGKKLGVRAKFAAAVNHMDISIDGKILIAGSGDTTIQVVKLEGSFPVVAKVEGHSAPVLSVAIDPLQKYFASSGCDGNVNIWSLTSDSKPPLLVKEWQNVFPKSTDIALSPTLCRMHWSPNGGRFLAIPEANKISLYFRENWNRTNSLQCKEFTKLISVVRYSSCSKLIAAGCSDGMIAMWNTGTAELLMKHSFASDMITGLIIPKAPTPELYIVDSKGRLHWISDISEQSEGNVGALNTAPHDKTSLLNSNPASPENGEDGDMFDDGMDDDLFGVPEDDDENEISISKIKAEVGFIDNEYVGVDRATQRKKGEDEDDRSSVNSGDGNASVRSLRTSMHTVNPFSEPQEPFQPNATPKHLEHRFMVWNNVGTIRSYTDDDDPAIDVEFHDPSHHSSIHLRNQFDYTMGCVTTDAIILACETGKDHPSKLFCLNYGSWDSTKEWTCDMPEGEEILAIGIGCNWIVAATNLNRLRLYSLGGVQHLLYDFPGQVVAISGFNNLLFLTYHYGLGVHGSQSIFFAVLLVKGHTLRRLILHSPLPLSTQSTLAWIGFTEEGTPAFSDSSNTLRILNGELWTPVCNMKEFLSGPNDHFWVVGLSQVEHNIRAVKCKGAKYPPTIPRPIQMILDAKIPLCELETEKSQMEEVILRSLMCLAVSKKMENKGFDTEDYKKISIKDFTDSMKKVFELSIKGNRNFRAVDYMSLVPTGADGIVECARIASKYKKNALVERLMTLAKQKMECESDQEEDDFESPNIPSLLGKSFSKCSAMVDSPHSQSSPDEISSISFSDASSEQSKTLTELGVENPLLQKQKDDIRKILCAEVRKSNPFKTSEEEFKKNDSQVQTNQRTITFIDAWKKPTDKPAELDFNPKHPRTKEVVKKRNRKSDKAGKETVNKETAANTKAKKAKISEME